MATYLGFPFDPELFNYNWANAKETESIESTPPPYLKSLSVGDIVIRFWLLSSSIKEFVNNTKTTETRL